MGANTPLDGQTKLWDAPEYGMTISRKVRTAHAASYCPPIRQNRILD